MKKYIYTFITFLLLGVILIPMLPKEKEINHTETIIEKSEVTYNFYYELILADSFEIDSNGGYFYEFEPSENPFYYIEIEVLDSALLVGLEPIYFTLYFTYFGDVELVDNQKVYFVADVGLPFSLFLGIVRDSLGKYSIVIPFVNVGRLNFKLYNLGVLQ